MSELVDFVAAFLLLAGAALSLTGGVGLLRMPGFYARTHATGITDTGGAGLLLLGLMLKAGFTLVTVKLITILAFLYLTSPTATHAVVKAAYARGVAFAPPREDG